MLRDMQCQSCHPEAIELGDEDVCYSLLQISAVMGYSVVYNYGISSSCLVRGHALGEQNWG